jgi:hypothetical protein
LNGESLQEFVATVEQLACRALLGLPVDFIQREIGHAFVDGVSDRGLKEHLLMGGDRSINDALNQALKLKAAKTAAGPAAGLRYVRARATIGTRSKPSEHRKDGRPVCRQCGNVGHLRRDCRQRPDNEVTYNKDAERLCNGRKSRREKGTPTSSSSPLFTLNVLTERSIDRSISECRIRENPCLVTIDTGASVTIVTSDIQGNPRGS